MEHVEAANDNGIPITPPPTRKPRGFAAMDRALVSAISRKGGVAAHVKGTAHTWTTEEAKAAGSKGGKAIHKKKAA
jgi:general stress protein YciG